jgi:hypothetical protein
MSGEARRRSRRWIPAWESTPAQPHGIGNAPGLESLEGRQLLSVFTGFSHVRNIATPSGIYNLQINGAGLLRPSPAGNGAIDLKVLGTDASSSLTITLVRPRYHLPSQLLSIRDLTIKSGQLGSLVADPVELDGSMTPLTTSMSTLEFGALGPGAQIDVQGAINTVNLGDVTLGPNGHVVIAGNPNGPTTSSTSSSTANGTGTVTVVGTVTGTITATGSGSGSSTTPINLQTVGSVTIKTLAIDGGRFVILGDSAAPIQVQGNMSLSRNGLFAIGRDQTGSVSLGGSLTIDSGGQLLVARNLSSLSVNGDVLINPGASGIVVGGNLGSLTVNGIFRGQGSPSAVDLGVGLNLTRFTVNGGTQNQGGLQSANINVGKSIGTLSIAHGIFRSWITAGVSIDGGMGTTGGGTSSTVTVGADGLNAIYNSEIDAGTSITNFTVGGNVTSGFPTGDTTGYPTRIIAGKVRSSDVTAGPDKGTYSPNGTISNFRINGTLTDAVLAASVVPYGGDGTLPPTPQYGVPARTCGPAPAGFSNYQAPGGLTDQTTPNYSIRNVTGGQPTGDAAWNEPPEVLHDCVLENGSVDVTVTGGVVSTAHGDNFDFAGVFAVNTVGVKRA